MRWLRSLLSLFFFLSFGIGGGVLSYLILPFVRRKEHALVVVRAIWWILLQGFRITRLLRVDASQLKRDVRGCVILANHPSLIDVVVLTVYMPKTFSVAKATLRRHPLIGLIVRRVFLFDDARLMDEAPDLLAKGYNILIFPEGTRSPSPNLMHSWHRGGVQLALRTNVSIHPICLHYSYRLLGKGQSILDMGVRPVTLTLSSFQEVSAISNGNENYHVQAVRLTKYLVDAYTATGIQTISKKGPFITH